MASENAPPFFGVKNIDKSRGKWRCGGNCFKKKEIRPFSRGEKPFQKGTLLLRNALKLFATAPWHVCHRAVARLPAPRGTSATAPWQMIKRHFVTVSRHARRGCLARLSGRCTEKPAGRHRRAGRGQWRGGAHCGQIEIVNARLLLHEHLAAVATLTQDVDTLVQFALRHAFTAEVVDGSAFKVGVVGGQCADSRVHVLLAHAD